MAEDERYDNLVHGVVNGEQCTNDIWLWQQHAGAPYTPHVKCGNENAEKSGEEMVCEWSTQEQENK